MPQTPRPPRRPRHPEAWLLVTAALWGGSYAACKDAMQSMSPLILVAARFGMAAILLALAAPRGVVRLTRRELFGGGVLGLILGGSMLLQNAAVALTSTSKAGFIIGLTVILAPFLQFLRGKGRMSRSQTVGALLALVGIYLLSDPAGGQVNLGDALMFLGAVLLSVHLLAVDHFASRNAIGLTIVQFATAALLAGAAAPALETVRLEATPALGLSLAYLVVFATLIAFVVQLRFQPETTPTRAAVVLCLEPVVAAAIGVGVLGEPLGVGVLVGGALILAGILVSEWRAAPARSAEPTC